MKYIWINWENKEISYTDKENCYQYRLHDAEKVIYINWKYQFASDEPYISQFDFCTFHLRKYLLEYCSKEQLITWLEEGLNMLDVYCNLPEDIQKMVDADFEECNSLFEKIKIYE